MAGLAGAVAVVTGAAGGLGAAVAEALLAEGAIPVLLDREEAQLAALASRLGADVRQLVCDVSDEQAVAAAAAEVGPCDVLVNNAALYARAPLEDHPVELWDSILAVNLRGYFLCTRSFGRTMLAQRRGSIVNVSSIAGAVATPQAAAYCASKAAVLALTRQTALEWGPRGIRANAVSPGFMNTSMSVADYGADPELTRAREERVPVRRVAEPAEVAGVVAFLAGPAASYVNGAELIVDGGLVHTLSETFPRR